MNISKLRQKVHFLRERRKIIEDTVMSISKMVRGCLVKQYGECGKVGCRCHRGEKHGPYYYWSISRNNRTVLIYVRDEIWLELKGKTQEFKRFWGLLQKIRKINKEIVEILDKIGESQIEEIEELKKGKRIRSKQI